MNITSEPEFCFQILGFDLNNVELILGIVQDQDELSETQIQNKLRESGHSFSLREIRPILEDMIHEDKLRIKYGSPKKYCLP